MNIIPKYSSYILAFLLLSIFTQSCREDTIKIVELNRIKITSYSELFDVFWDRMNNNYNYFFEEGTNWDDVYETYSPKFKKLRTFNDPNADTKVALREANLSFKYFADIISKLKDGHLKVTVTIPLPSYRDRYNSDNDPPPAFVRIFSGGMKYNYSEEKGFKTVKGYNFNPNPRVDTKVVRSIAKERFNKSTSFISEPPYSGFYFLAGYFNSDPSVMYINFNKFSVTHYIDATDKFPVLHHVDKKNMTEDMFEEIKELEPAFTEKIKKMMMDNLEGVYNSLLYVLESNEYKEYLDARTYFLNTDDISKLDAIKEDFDNFVTSATEVYVADNKAITRYANEYIKENKDTSRYKAKAVNTLRKKYQRIYKNLFFFSSLMSDTEGYSGNLTLGATVRNSCDKYGEVYKKLFNRLTKGEVKKIILDLRGNRGGDAEDAPYFISRFITKKAIWGYYRTKEGNGRFNYGPWLPFEIKPHKFHIPKNIPIVILLDRGSKSMSEISSMILKSQGEHVKIIGDNSAGATAALGNSDNFNGGAKDDMQNYISFYMPLLAYKTLDGKVIEREGITPDIKITPIKEDVVEMQKTKYDPVLERALEEIRKMTVK